MWREGWCLGRGCVEGWEAGRLGCGGRAGVEGVRGWSGVEWSGVGVEGGEVEGVEGGWECGMVGSEPGAEAGAGSVPQRMAGD